MRKGTIYMIGALIYWTVLGTINPKRSKSMINNAAMSSMPSYISKIDNFSAKSSNLLSATKLAKTLSTYAWLGIKISNSLPR
jgi:hypothetical protein